VKRKKSFQRKREAAARTRRPRQKDALPAAAREAITSGRQISLLSLEMQGWRLKQSWPGLFDLYTKGKNVRVELSSELNLVRIRIKRNLLPADMECITFARGLWVLLLLAQAKTDGHRADTFGFIELKNKALEDFVSTLGPHVLTVLSAKKESTAENARDAAVGLMRRTMNSLIREKFPTPPRATKDGVAKEWFAIFSARDLVYELRRLPTKSEVRERLKLLGIDFSPNSRSYEKDWADVFGRAGLDSLPD
jgi:hypothetical protein